ncbi:MAG TPA: hypothetical protein VEC18_02710 [Myxococcota bacterium]|nr:hypothetical protein [Myxococcota bacterium]
MDQRPDLIAIFAGGFYLVASLRLFRLGRRSGKRPELLLGAYFAGAGQWFAIQNGALLIGFDALPALAEQVAEWVYVASVIAYLLFIKTVFRARDAWAHSLVGAAIAYLLLGASALSVSGELVSALDNPWFLIEWIGYTIPCVWMSVEGVLAHARAKRRVAIGICDPIVADRFLLMGAFGFFQCVACAAELFWAAENVATPLFSSAAFRLLGAAEAASIALLWLAFFPPRLYQRWVENRSAALARAGGLRP